MDCSKVPTSSIIIEQKFGELVKSIKQSSHNLDDEQSEKFYSLINDNFQIKYELIQNQQASKLFNLQLLKISCFQFIKSYECYFCIIFNFVKDTLKQRLKNEIMKYSFQTQFFDFTLQKVNNINLKTELEAFENYANKNYRECRIIIFSQDFDERILDKVDSYPYIYYCADPSSINQKYLENLQLSQIFLTLDLQYKRILYQLPTALSILNQQIYTNIQITVLIGEIPDIIYQIKHPSLKFEKLKEKIILSYQIPYMNVDQYLYLPISLQIQKIEISDLIQKTENLTNLLSTKDVNNEAFDYIYKLQLLKQINDQINLSQLEFSIISKDQFFAVDQLMFRNQIKQIKELQKVSENNDDELNQIEKVLEDLCNCNKPSFFKLITYHQIKQCIFYRMKINNFIYQL